MSLERLKAYKILDIFFLYVLEKENKYLIRTTPECFRNTFTAREKSNQLCY
jgi:hypothetical protein